MIRVKICGLTSENDVRAAIKLGVDYLGFVIEPGRRRSVSLAEASRLAMLADRLAGDSVKTVAVALQPLPEWLPGNSGNDPLAAFSLLQFYQQQQWPWQADRRLKVVASPEDCRAAPLYLFDRSHGSGVWEEPPHWLCQYPVLFAGGVDINRIDQLRHLYGVDVSSGLETNGRKDYLLMQNFMEAINGQRLL